MYLIRRYLTEDLRILLVKTLILSKLDYCNALYAGLPKKLTNKLQTVLRSCIKFIYKIDGRGEDLDVYFQKAHILPIEYRIQFKVCLFVHKMFHGKVPDYLGTLLTVYHPGVSSLRTGKDKYMLATPPFLNMPLTTGTSSPSTSEAVQMPMVLRRTSRHTSSVKRS